jgi:hypothetical protein
MKKVVILIIIIGCFSCKGNNDELEYNKANALTPPLRSVRHNMKHIIPDIPLCSKKDINPKVFSHFLKKYGIKEVTPINKNTRFLIEHNEKQAFCLFFKNNIPKRAGKYVNNSPYRIFDFFYQDSFSANNAYNNILFELTEDEKINYNFYFPYFKGENCVFLLDNKKSNITIFFYQDENVYMNKFIRNNSSIYDKILTADAFGCKIVK